MFWSFHPSADKTNNEHLTKPFFKVMWKSLYDHLSDKWHYTVEIGAAQFQSVTEIAPKSSFLCVNRGPIRAGAKAFRHSVNIAFYKITKIVRALWLAERRVCMRVCKHGCGVKMFCFSRANHASTNLKKFSSSKLDKFWLYLLIPSSAETWKIVTKKVCHFFFA